MNATLLVNPKGLLLFSCSCNDHLSLIMVWYAYLIICHYHVCRPSLKRRGCCWILMPRPSRLLDRRSDMKRMLEVSCTGTNPPPETRPSARPSTVPYRSDRLRAVCVNGCALSEKVTCLMECFECVWGQMCVCINRRASNAPLLCIISAGPISITNDRCIILKSHKAQHSSILLSGPKTLGNYSLCYISIFTYNNAADAGLSFNQIIFHLPLSCQLPLEGEELFIKAHGHPSWGISVSLSRLRFCLLITHIPPIPTLSSAHFLHFSTLYLG